MAEGKYPSFFAERIFPHKEALKLTITSDSAVASGFATSEPVSFYANLWDHIQEEDITDLTVKNGLFMAPHKFCIGDTLGARGKLEGWSDRLSFLPGLAGTAGRINQANPETRRTGKARKPLRGTQGETHKGRLGVHRTSRQHSHSLEHSHPLPLSRIRREKQHQDGRHRHARHPFPRRLLLARLRPRHGPHVRHLRHRDDAAQRGRAN